MAVNRNTYGLPDSTLQLIAGSPELSIPMMQQGSAAQFATPDVRRSDLISALRGISGPANPGFTRYANGANGAALTPSSRKYRGANNPGMLGMGKYVAPEVVLPGGEIGTPYVKPDTPFVNDFVFRDVVVDDDVVDDDVVDDDVVDDDVVDDDVVIDDDVVDDNVVIDDTVEDGFDIDLDTTLLEDVVVPDEKEKTGIVDMEVVDGLEAQDDGTTDGILDLINAGFGDGSEREGTVIIEPVDPDEESPQDDGTTADILDLINYLNSSLGASGGGKAIFDETAGTMEF